MIISWLKTYAIWIQLACCAALVSLCLIQTWRLSSAHDKIDEQRQLIVDVKAANFANMATIEALRKANADWSAKCEAEPERWKVVIADMKKQHELEKKNLTNAPAKREVIYREVNDKCHAQPVPADIAERLRN